MITEDNDSHNISTYDCLHDSGRNNYYIYLIEYKRLSQIEISSSGSHFMRPNTSNPRIKKNPDPNNLRCNQ